MEPLRQWVCDHCRELIAKPGHGWLEWIDDEGGAHSFKIVHWGGDCYHHTGHLDMADAYLSDYLGADGMPKLLSFLDLGPYHDPEGKSVPGVKDLREFVELMRRLTIPYYEEARLHWAKAKAEGFFADANEVWIYMPKTLKALIEHYGEGD